MSCSFLMQILIPTDREDLDMTVEHMKQLFTSIEPDRSWKLQLLQIQPDDMGAPAYASRLITLSPEDSLLNVVADIRKRYVVGKRCAFQGYSTVMDYDASASGSVIYHIAADSDLIQTQLKALLNCIANPEAEAGLNEFFPCASVLQGEVCDGGVRRSIKLVSMRSPVTTLKHKFYYEAGQFHEISDKVLSLNTSVDVILYADEVYLLSMEGEKLFQMERAYKKVTEKRLEEIIQSDIISDAKKFCDVARSGHNPRRFVSFSQKRLNQMKKDRKLRHTMSKKFSIPLEGEQFNTSTLEYAERLVKILCKKGMSDPFEKDAPVEVTGAAKWQ